MQNINTPKILSLNEQRENLLEFNHDIIYGVYRLLSQDDSSVQIELVENVMTCYKNKLDNDEISIPDDCSDITIINLKKLQGGEVDILKGPNNIADTNDLILLSGGVIEYIEGSTGKKHLITTLRDGGSADKLQRTTTAGRNTGDDLKEEVEREHYEEGPFLGKNDSGDYCLAIPEGNPQGAEYTNKSILWWLENKYNLDHEQEHDFITMFERSFPGIGYEELGTILRDIVSNDRFMSYEWENGEIQGIGDGMKEIQITNSTGSTINAYSFLDKDNNTLEYRDVRRIKGIPEGFHLLGNRPGKLFLESQNQYSRIPRIENAYKNKAVPTIEHVSKQADAILKGKNIQDVVLSFLNENKETSINDYNWNELQSRLNQPWNALHIRQSKEQRDPIERMSYNTVYSSDSSVFTIDDSHIIKIYNSHSVEVIKKYHKLQNLLSQSNFTLQKSGEVNGEKFNSIEVSVLPLNSELIFGENGYCFSIVDKLISTNEIKDITFDDKSEFSGGIITRNDKDYIKNDIMNLIHSTNPHGIDIQKDIHQMNFVVQEIKNGVLKLVITDIGNLIDDFVKMNKDIPFTD